MTKAELAAEVRKLRASLDRAKAKAVRLEAKLTQSQKALSARDQDVTGALDCQAATAGPVPAFRLLDLRTP